MSRSSSSDQAKAGHQASTTDSEYAQVCKWLKKIEKHLSGIQNLEANIEMRQHMQTPSDVQAATRHMSSYVEGDSSMFSPTQVKILGKQQDKYCKNEAQHDSPRSSPEMSSAPSVMGPRWREKISDEG